VRYTLEAALGAVALSGAAISGTLSYPSALSGVLFYLGLCLGFGLLLGEAAAKVLEELRGPRGSGSDGNQRSWSSLTGSLGAVVGLVIFGIATAIALID